MYSTHTPVFGHDGRLIIVITVSADITDRQLGGDDSGQLSAPGGCPGVADFKVTNDGTVTSWSSAAEELFGYTAWEIVGQLIFVLTPSGRDAQHAGLRDRLGAGGQSEHLETTRGRKDGGLVDVLITASPTTDESGTVVGQSVTARDITARRSAERALDAAMCALLGRPEELLVGRRWDDYTHPDELPLRQAVLIRVGAGQDTYEDERRFVLPDGSVVWASSHVTLVRDASGLPQYFFAQFQDITSRKQMEEELAHQALHDALTGLPNRALLGNRLVHSLASSRRRDSHVGVMFLDIDHFKAVNDSLGHTFGDDLLRQAADRIAGAIRSGDTVARFGGDEFVIV